VLRPYDLNGTLPATGGLLLRDVDDGNNVLGTVWSVPELRLPTDWATYYYRMSWRPVPAARAVS
jgi:hypothetical protein